MKFEDNENLIKFELENANMELFLKYERELEIALQHNERRFWHSISVALTAINIAEIYNADKDECLIAGLLHDYCKTFKYDELIAECKKYNVVLSDEDKMADGCIHGFLAAKVCREKYDINDNIYNAIYYHTCGRPNMSILEKIIYMADFIEPLRKFRDKVDHIRKLCFSNNIDKAIVLTAELNIEYLIKRNKYIHSNTYKTRDYYKSIIENKREK